MYYLWLVVLSPQSLYKYDLGWRISKGSTGCRWARNNCLMCSSIRPGVRWRCSRTFSSDHVSRSGVAWSRIVKCHEKEESAKRHLQRQYSSFDSFTAAAAAAVVATTISTYQYYAAMTPLLLVCAFGYMLYCYYCDLPALWPVVWSQTARRRKSLELATTTRRVSSTRI